MVTLLTLVAVVGLAVIDEVATELEVLKADRALLRHAKICLPWPTLRMEVEAPVMQAQITQKSRFSSPFKSIKDIVTTILAQLVKLVT